MCKFVGYELIFTVTTVVDRSIVFSIMPKFHDWLFCDLRFLCMFVVNLSVFCKSNQKQFHVHNLYKTCKSTNNPLSNFGIPNWRNYGSALYSLFVYVILLVCKHVLGNYSMYGSNSMHPILWWHIDFVNEYIFTAIYVGQYLFFLTSLILLFIKAEWFEKNVVNRH